MAPPTKKPSKPVFKTSLPFTETQWPLVSHEDQEVITELLCNLLTPLGDHRRAHTQPSKGKKRKRSTEPCPDEARPLQPPAIGSYLLIGLNSVTRHLETLAASTAPPTRPLPVMESKVNEHDRAMSEDSAEQKSETSHRRLSLIILTHPQPSLSPSHAHVPTLVHLAAVRPNSTPTPSDFVRLVALPTSNDTRFANALHIPRVAAIGMFEGAPGAKALEDYVKKHVGFTKCAWIGEACSPEWRGLNVQQV